MVYWAVTNKNTFKSFEKVFKNSLSFFSILPQICAFYGLLLLNRLPNTLDLAAVYFWLNDYLYFRSKNSTQDEVKRGDWQLKAGAGCANKDKKEYRKNSLPDRWRSFGENSDEELDELFCHQSWRLPFITWNDKKSLFVFCLLCVFISFDMVT